MRQTYFDYDALRTFDTSYEYPGFTFNAGQILATSGVVKRDHFAGLVDWRPALPQMVRPDIFSCGDQGIMNYILAAKALKGEITLGKGSFMVWPKSQAAQALELKRVGQGEAGYPFLLHWAGLGHPFSFRKMLLGKWLLHYEAEYYSKIRAGTLKRLTRQTQLWCWYKKCRLKQKLGLG